MLSYDTTASGYSVLLRPSWPWVLNSSVATEASVSFKGLLPENILILESRTCNEHGMTLLALCPSGLYAFHWPAVAPLWQWILPQSPLSSSQCITLEVIPSAKTLRVGTSDGLLYTLSDEGQEKYWTFTGDTPLQTLSMDVKKETYLVSSADGDVGFYRGPSCLGEISFNECVIQLTRFDEASPWTFGFATNSWMGAYEKTRCLWKLKVGSDRQITCMKSCSTGDTSFLAIGYAHGLIETRQRETGELLEYWNIETKDLVSLLFDSNDKLLAVTESGTRHLFTPSVFNPVKSETKRKKEPLAPLKELPPVSVKEKTRVRTHLECITDHSGSMQVILNVSVSAPLKAERILIQSPVLKKSVYRQFSANESSLSLPIPLNLHHGAGVLQLTLFLQSDKENEFMLEHSSVPVPEYSLCQLVTTKYVMPELQATLSWSSSMVRFKHLEWISSHFLSFKVSNDEISVLKWIDVEDRELVIEIITQKIRLYGDKKWAQQVASLMLQDNPGINLHFEQRSPSVLHKSNATSLQDIYESVVRLNEQVDNAQTCRYWEDVMTLNAQIFEILNGTCLR